MATRGFCNSDLEKMRICIIYFYVYIHKQLGGPNCGIRNISFRVYTGRHITFMSSVSCLDALVSLTNKLK